jgi:hypothetical protein
VLGTLSPELMESARTFGGTARRAWLTIEEQFLGNREARALCLDAEFCVFMQGDLSIGDYHRKMKGMAEALGEVIHDRTHALNVQCGLNEKFVHMEVHFKRSKSFSFFADVRNGPILEEIDSSMPPLPSATTLVASTTASSIAPPPGGVMAPAGGTI